GVEVADPGAVRAARWTDMSVLRAPHQLVASLTTTDMEATPYQTHGRHMGRRPYLDFLLHHRAAYRSSGTSGGAPFWPSSSAVWSSIRGGMLPPVAPVYRSVREARGGPRGRGWT
ncbi:hypothetical protein KI387_029763, partial [Taxus chinensis]